MKQLLLSLLVMLSALQPLLAQSPGIGIYPAATIATAGGNATVIPSTAPIGFTTITASATGNFKGILQANPVTGVVTITNAQPAGVYTITVGTLALRTSFILTVGNTRCSQGLLSGTATLPIGSNPQAVAIGDFNNDGIQDIATANTGSNTISVRLGDGTGGLSETIASNTINSPTCIAVADYNGDGKQDMAVGNANDNIILILLGNGTGSFSGNISVTAGYQPSLATSDFNGDGIPDLAVASRLSNSVFIRVGDGTGGFIGTTELYVGLNPYSIATGDFNNDGTTDFATANSGSNNVSVYLGYGWGLFFPAPDVVVGNAPRSIAIGDVNGDGISDMATANYFANTVSVRLGDGLGNFSGTTAFSTAFNPVAIAIGDFTGDGKPDFATAAYTSNSISIGIGNGIGGNSGNTSTSVGTNPCSIAIGDFNGDGKHDLAIVNQNSNNVSIRINSDREINVQGNNTNIPDGSNTTSTDNNTDFGSTIDGSSFVRTFTIQNTGRSSLTVSSITISGTHSSLFTVGGISLPTVISAGTSATFTLIFIPTGNGFKTARVNITSNDCDETIYDFAVKGVAVCQATGASNIWLGITNNWNAAGNWSLGFVPSECTPVVINNGVPFMPQITGMNNSCYSLTLTNGATLSVNNAGQLNITKNN